jgi:hypothetical protein
MEKHAKRRWYKLSFQIIFFSYFDSPIWKTLRFQSELPSFKMPSSLLTIPYELREQILTYLLYQEDSIELQYPSATRNYLVPPLVQVCTSLREEAIAIFYHINTFTWTIDPDTVSLVLRPPLWMYRFI